jgi:hypothetical protein
MELIDNKRAGMPQLKVNATLHTEDIQASQEALFWVVLNWNLKVKLKVHAVGNLRRLPAADYSKELMQLMLGFNKLLVDNFSKEESRLMAPGLHGQI